MRIETAREARHWSDQPVLQGRAFFHADETPAKLVIDDSQTEDEGLYKCRVDFKTAPTRISEINVNVVGKKSTDFYISFSGDFL